jgi:integrase
MTTISAAIDLHSMVGKRAKILSPDHVEDPLVFAAQTRVPIRNQVLVLLSLKASLRAGEIANLTWSMLAEPSGEIGKSLELQTRLPWRSSAPVLQRVLGRLHEQDRVPAPARQVPTSNVWSRMRKPLWWLLSAECGIVPHPSARAR